MFELLELRKREITELEEEIKKLSSRLNELWASKSVNPEKERILKDEMYSDKRFFEGSVVYTIAYPPYKFDFPPRVIGSKVTKVELVWRKIPDYWEREWWNVYDLSIAQSKENFISFPPELIGKEEIVRDIDNTVKLIGYEPPKDFMESFDGETLGEKIYNAITQGRRVSTSKFLRYI
jgi:hypothetical protein